MEGPPLLPGIKTFKIHVEGKFLIDFTDMIVLRIMWIKYYKILRGYLFATIISLDSEAAR